MPSPFPGMDPFIENQKWEDFHLKFIAAMSDSLVPRVRPKYEVSAGERVYVEHHPDESRVVRPDITVLEGDWDGSSSEAGTAAAVALAPAVLTLPTTELEREAFLTIRRREKMDVVTVIEVLSPGNKRPGTDGREQYFSKRDVILKSPTHLVELDILRAGRRLPTMEPLPRGDYYAFIRRGKRRYKVEVYAWSLRRPLPQIPIPLAGDDPDVLLDLQAIFNTVYDRAGYDYSLDYRRPVVPPLREADADWAKQLLGKAPVPPQ